MGDAPYQRDDLGPDNLPDEHSLLRSAELCLSSDAQQRQQGLKMLANHPDSRGLKLTCLLARHLIRDENAEIAKNALFTLGFGVGRNRWSWNPDNLHETEVVKFASDLCRNLSEVDIYRLLTLCDHEEFHGPQGLGERLCDVLGCCPETAENVLNRVMRDQTEPMQRRANALYLRSGCDEEDLERAEDDLTDDPKTLDLAQWMLRQREAENGGQ